MHSEWLKLIGFRALAEVHSQAWLRPFLTAKEHYLLCRTARGLLLPFEKEFDGLARDSRAIIDHKFEITQRELANQTGADPDGYTSDHVGLEETEESGYSS